MKAYKVLNTDGTAFHGGTGKWPLPNGQPGDWVQITGDLVACRRGLHLCRKTDLVSWLGPAIFIAEYKGEKLDAGDKIVVRQARLLERVEAWNDTTARLFAADCAEHVLRRIPESHREPFVEAIRVARLFARGEVSDSQRAAAGDAARDAAGDAARAAAGAAARDAAGDAARAAARAAAGDAAWAAAGAAAWAAAGAAARDAAWAAERRWQTRRLFEYLNGTRLP